MMETIISVPRARLSSMATRVPKSTDSAMLTPTTKSRMGRPERFRSIARTMAVWAQMAPTTMAKLMPMPQVTGRIRARTKRVLRMKRV